MTLLLILLAVTAWCLVSVPLGLVVGRALASGRSQGLDGRARFELAA